MAFPGAKPAGDASHLSRLPSVHLIVAFADSALEYAKPSLAAMFYPGRPPSAGPTEWADREWHVEHRFLKTLSPMAGFPDSFFFLGGISVF